MVKNEKVPKFMIKGVAILQGTKIRNLLTKTNWTRHLIIKSTFELHYTSYIFNFDNVSLLIDFAQVTAKG